jgi:branched-chain amino acid transport system ATP-binding protein
MHLQKFQVQVPNNSLFAIIGPNGAGKTSIFNCVSGIYRPTSGVVKIFDEDISRY